MAATILIRELNGAGATPTDKTSGSLRFKLADNSTVDLQNPIRIPTSQTAFSYEKVTRLYISGGTFTEVSNLRMYTDGINGYGTGCKLWVLPLGSFETPVVPNVANDPPLHSATPFVDMFAFTSGSPLDIDAINAGPFNSSGLPKAIGDFVYMVAEVEPAASDGMKAAETITVAWDEVG